MGVQDMAPVQVTVNGSAQATIPVFDVGIPFNIDSRQIRHSGQLYPGSILHAGGQPVVTLTMPAKAALDTFGLTAAALDDFKIWFATYASGVRQSGANHTNIQAASGGYAIVDSISVSQGGVAIASVRMWPLASSDIANPWTRNNSASLPTLSAEPTLNTLGPVALANSIISGVQNISVNFNHRANPLPKDGARYMRDWIYGGSTPSITGTHNTYLDLQTALGFEGTAITDVDVYLRENDTANGTLKTTGIQLAITDGYWQVDNAPLSQDSVANASWTVVAESTSTTFPIAYTASATVQT